MELVLIGNLVFLAVFGFWIMGKLDRFLDSGKFSSAPDEAERGAETTDARDRDAAS